MGQPEITTTGKTEIQGESSIPVLRYFNAKYKIWFQFLWGLLLFFFLTLTVYQVCERINFYFIKNPLNTRRIYETPQSVRFPKIAICNKMQLRASFVAEQNPELARALSTVFEDDGKITKNQTLLVRLSEFNQVNLAEIYKASYQKIEDLFVSCEVGKSGSCMDDIKPFFTSNGLCFHVSPNVTVRRPGPEITLSMLLNLEVHEIIPGMVPDPGVMLSIQEGDAVEFSQGIHLEAGKVVTIPINEVRKLHRYERYCGRLAIPPFTKKEYSLESCQWATTMERVERFCSCRPVSSPHNRFFLPGINGTNYDKGGKRIEPCTVKEELVCVEKAYSYSSDAEEWPMIENCPEDCQEISYPSVVFGESLIPSDVATYLPSDWDDNKEKKIMQFQKILDVIPLERIPVVRSLQVLAYQLQDFLENSSRILGVDGHLNGTHCLKDRGFRPLDHVIARIKSIEPHWEAVATYIRHSLSRQMNTTAVAVGLKMNEEGLLSGSDSQFEVDIPLVEAALIQLRSMEAHLQPESMFGLRHLLPDTRAKLVRNGKLFIDWHHQDLVEPFVRRMHKCLLKLRNKPDMKEEIGSECRSIFTKHYETLMDAYKFYTTTDTSTENFTEYEEMIAKITTAIQRVKSRVYMATWRNHKIDLKRTEMLYRENAVDYNELVELLKLRKVILTDITETIWKLVTHLESGLEAKRRFERHFELSSHEDEMGKINNVLNCLKTTAEAVPSLKKSLFIRGEWLPKLQRFVQTAQSFSSGPQYDQVNLLHIKLYFAHFKQETIVQDRSYNLFLLLAEIGGTIGLYVGASVLSVAETVVLFFEKKLRNNVVKPVSI